MRISSIDACWLLATCCCLSGCAGSRPQVMPVPGSPENVPTPRIASAGPVQNPAPQAGYIPCWADQAKRQSRSDELQRLMAADQADRQNWQHFDQKAKAEIDRISERDRERRKRVGEIFGEGCILEAKDYAAAALVFQHGDRPDHFWQTAMWVKRAVEMGETKYQRLTCVFG